MRSRWISRTTRSTPVAGDAVVLTWEQYAERVRRTGAGLAALGVRRGDVVAVMLTNRPEFLWVDVAAMHHLRPRAGRLRAARRRCRGGRHTGIQDAFNLGWKLAAVVAAGAPADLLETYDTERRPIAEQVLAAAHALQGITTGHGVPLAERIALIRQPDFTRATVEKLSGVT